MAYRKEIDENFQFLLLEVKSQIQNTLKVLNGSGDVLEEDMEARDDYIDNLKSVIESKCFSQIFYVTERDIQMVNLMKSVITITSNLERIADYAVNIVQQTHHFENKAFIKRYNFEAFFWEINDAMELVYNATFARDIQNGIKICRSEIKLDELYKSVFKDILEELRSGQNVESLLTAIFIFRYLERMGDCLLNIGEAIISAAVGEKLKIDQYEALEESIQEARMKGHISEFSIESIWETRSGCRIARVMNKNGDGASTAAIFKEGRLKKLQDEKESIERWQKLMPGLPPRIFGFQVHGDNGSLLLENFSGDTLESLILYGSDEEIERALASIIETLNDIWTRTKKPDPVNAEQFKQLLERIDDVRKVHPEYDFEDKVIGNLETPSLDKLLMRASGIDQQLYAPFRVFIHGDFNIDNVIFNKENDHLHFIDLHRSCEQDYVQDVSVFMVSAFRIPLTEPTIRKRLTDVIDRFFNFAHDFALKNDDPTFEARLTLGLIRNFTSSTRFELKEDFAKSMYLRAIFLIEKLLDHDHKPWEDFKLPRETLTY